MRASTRFAILALLALSLAGLASIRRSAGPGGASRLARTAPGEFEEVGKRPNDWFHVQRAFPAAEIPLGAHRRALDQALAMRDSQARAEAGGEAKVASLAWDLAGPTNIGGRITAIGSHTSNPSTIYAGAADGGIWKSVNAGVNWTPVFDGWGSQSIGALVVAPSDPALVYVGTGEANASGDSYDGDGVHVTHDGGDSWQYLGLAETRRIGKIALDPTNPERIYVAAAGPLFSKDGNRGVYRSTNGGFTWERTLFVSDSTSAIDVLVEPGSPQNVYAAMWERIRRANHRRVGGFTSGIYKSTDFGVTWTLLTNGLPASGPTVGRIGLSAAVTAPGTLVAYYCDHPGNFMGVYRTTDAGASWARMNDGALSGITGGFGWYFGQIRIDPTNANRIFVLGVPLYRTTNGGSTWSSVGSGTHVDHHDLWIDPGLNTRVYEGDDGGVFVSANGGSAWTKSFNLPITQFYAITVDHLNPLQRLGGTQDNGTLRTSTGSLSDWQNIYPGDGFYCLVDPTNSNVIFAEYQYGGLGKSTDGGFGFVDAVTGINSGDRRNWSTPVVMDPNNPQIMYYGTYRMWRSVNGATTWSSISPDLTLGNDPGNLEFGTITTIAVAKTNPSVIYAGTDDSQVWVTQNLGLNWTNVAGALPDRWVTRVAVDPTDAGIAYATISGYRNDEYLPHVFRTTDFGASWSDISGSLPESPLNALIVDPANPATLYVASDVGVFVTYDTGASWTPLGSSGLPPAVVSDLALHAPTRTLYAGTHGRSMYSYALPASPTDVGPGPTIASGSGLSVGAPTPNPVRERTRVTLALARETEVHAAVFDVSGRRVRDLGRRLLPAGAHAIEWDRADDGGTRVATGTYVLRVAAGPLAETRKLTLID
jgi:photosystem II stability/assembly factor-like uncharacterized protein